MAETSVSERTVKAYTTPRTPRYARTAVLALAVALLGACAPRAPESDVQAELAKLRQEHRALMAEIRALKSEMRNVQQHLSQSRSLMMLLLKTLSTPPMTQAL